MTREEQISIAANKHIEDTVYGMASYEVIEDMYNAFIEGAKWADKHPLQGE